MTDTPKPTQGHQQQVSLKISDEVQRGTYANRAIISHTRDEFVLDFVADFPPGPQIVSRVITSPGHARALLRTLAETLDRYDKAKAGGGVSRPPASA